MGHNLGRFIQLILNPPNINTIKTLEHWHVPLKMLVVVVIIIPLSNLLV